VHFMSISSDFLFSVSEKPVSVNCNKHSQLFAGRVKFKYWQWYQSIKTELYCDLDIGDCTGGVRCKECSW